jgi:hypothetical protein
MERKTVTKDQRPPARDSHVHRKAAASHDSRLLGLQRSIGNHAVQRLIQSPYIQTKLQVSTPGDPLEQEADRTTDTVMRMREPVVSRQALGQPVITPLAQRESDQSDEEDTMVARKSHRIPVAVREDDDEEEKVQRACDDCEEDTINRKETDDEEEVISRAAVTPHVPASANIHAMQGGGNPLPPATRAFFEPRFGADFSHVRIHTDQRAADTAKSINARAFTAGRDIVFGAGQDSFESHEGRRLLAHELTHVVQQNGSSRSSEGGPAATHVHRYISSEHMDLGEAATGRTITLDLWAGPPEPFTKTRKVILTYGQVNALLGDYYEGWSQLKKAPAPEVERLVDLFKRERTAVAGKKPLPSEAEYEQATAGRKTGAGQAGASTKTYLELAEENVAHFSPDHRQRFSRQHKEALKRGVDAFNLRAKGKTGDADAAEADAFLINADADHFMQDAFAAGHLMNKPLIQLATVEFWTTEMGNVARDSLRAAALKDQARIWAEIDRHVLPHLTGTQAWALRHVFDRPEAIRRVIDQILDRIQGRPDLTANLGAKLVHDHLNRNGVQVFSEADPKTGWRTFGDSFMSKGVTINKIVAAQKASVANVESAVKDGLGQVTKAVDIDAFLKTNNPWQLVPRWAEVPAGTRREVGTALADRSWVHDLLKTLLFNDDPSSPLYLLLLENLQLVGGIMAAEQQATAQRHTKQASAAETLLKRFSKNFAKGGAPDDVDSEGLARALRGKPADLFQEILDRLEPEDKDDNVAQEFAELHPRRADLVALDTAVLLGMAGAMRGGITTWGETTAIARIEAALLFKVGQRLLAQVPLGERKDGQRILDTLGTQGKQHIADVGAAGNLESSTMKRTFQPKELAADCKGQNPDVLLGVIRVLFFDAEIKAWLVEFVPLHTDAELDTLDVAVLQEAATRLPAGKQRKRAEKARVDALARGATTTAKADRTRGAELVKKRKFVTYPKLAQALKGKSSEVIITTLGRLRDDAPPVAADFTKLYTDDELAKIDLAVLHRLAKHVQDPAELARVQKALQRALKEAAGRTVI